MVYVDFRAGNKDYKLRLNTRNTVALEKALGCNPLAIFGNGDELYFEFATKVMRIFLSMIIAVGIQFVSSNFFASIGQPIKGVILSFTRQILFVIPLMLILPIFIGIDGVVFAGPISDLLSCLIAIYFIRREFKKINKMIKVEED